MTTTVNNRNSKVVDVPPALLKQWLEAGEAVLVDVREDFEYASEHIPGAVLKPLSKFDANALPTTRENQKIVLQCRSGNRSCKAADRVLNEGGAAAYHLAGGIEAWKTAGLPVERSATAPPIDVMRQVQIVAGSLVLIGVLLGAFVSPWFLVLSGFIGAGLTTAGLTGFCGMAKMLGAMPWNRAAVG